MVDTYTFDGPTTAEEICNLTLDLLKQSIIADIDALTGNSPVCKRWYHPTRRALLRAHPWKFAIKRAILTPSATAPTFGYPNAYALPADYIRLVTIGDDSLDDIRRRYEIESGQILLDPTSPSSATGNIDIRYIYDITTVSEFDALFVQLLVTLMAIKMSTKFSIGAAQKKELKEDLLDMTVEARAVNGQDKGPKRVQYSKILTKRRGLPGGVSASPFTVFE